MIEPDEKLLKSWKLQRQNLEAILGSEWGWIPIETGENVDEDLAPNVDSNLIEYVKCPQCEREYKLLQLTWVAGHEIRCVAQLSNS